MGGQQSTSRNNPTPSSTPQKSCYYDLLSIPRTATDDEIKKAYRRKALELHPDRNYNDVARTTALFAEVQTAYQILSDPQERAWYDAHRDAILSGRDPNTSQGDVPVDVTSAEEVLAWTSQFSVRMSFDDQDPRGFWALAREAFGKLAEEERTAARHEGVEEPELPGFGNDWDKYEEEGSVKRFYQAWGAFYTVKTFAWCDLYRLSDAPDRRVRRMMEKDNAKARDQGRAAFNDAVSAFVKFVRKRDPRYTPNSFSEKKRQEELKRKSAAQAKRQRAENAKMREEYVAPSWVVAGGEELDDEAPKVVRAEEICEEEVGEEEWYECVVCRKGFRSEGQMKAHEKSKKHQKAVWQLKKQMRKEDREFELDERDVWTGRPVEEEVREKVVFTAVDSDGEVEDMVPIPQDAPWEEESDEETTAPAPRDEDDHIPIPPRSPTLSPSESDPDSDYVSQETFAARTAAITTETSIDDLTSALDSTTLEPSAPKLGKAKAKRLKKAQQQQQQKTGEEAASEFTCSGCGNEFPSKTKLFNHLKSNPSHATLIHVEDAAGGGKKKKGKGRR